MQGPDHVVSCDTPTLAAPAPDAIGARIAADRKREPAELGANLFDTNP